MKTVRIIAFRLGQVSSKKLTTPFIDFYKWLSQAYYGKECKIINKDRLYTIPITNKMMLSDPYMPNKTFSEKVSKWEQDPNLIIIDMSNPPHRFIRGGLLVQLVSAIRDFQSREECTTNCVILIPELLPENELARTILNENIKNGKVTFISDAGDKDGTVPSKTLSKKEYVEQLTSVREDPFNLLKLKMIRRVGHYIKKYKGDPYRCVRYYFDGQLCINELLTLLRLRIVEVCEGKYLPFIIYNAPISRWFEEVMLIFQGDGLIVNKFKDIESITYDKKEMKPFLMVPMVDTGETISELIRKLTADESFNDLNIITIMSTRSTDKTEKKRILNVKGTEHELEYFLEVEQKSYQKYECLLCNLGVPESKEYHCDDSLFLFAWDKWDMVYEDGVGWKKESDPPPYRVKLRRVPKYPELMEKNGPWLALKIHELLKMIPIKLQPDKVIVCPEEIGSVALTKFLKLVSDVNVIRIPKKHIDDIIKDGEVDHDIMEKWRAANYNWYHQLFTLTTNRIILMDEFNISGTTRQVMSKVIEHFNLNVACYVSFVDFNPKESSECKIPCYSLYEIQLPLV